MQNRLYRYIVLLLFVIGVGSLKAFPAGMPPVTAYRICINADASEAERWAATELQHWLFEISRVFLPIQTTGTVFTGSEIVLGYNEVVKNITRGLQPADNDESYHYFSANGNVYIYGGKNRGTMYGVFSFLENEFGCRWYTPSVSVIPKRNNLVLGTYNYKESPGIRVRNNFYFEAFDPQWAARNKMNGRMYMYLPYKNIMDGGFFYKEQPGGQETYWSVHTFYSLMPPDEYYDRHPEYFSVNKGVRSKTKGQLCLSNPAVQKIVTQKLKEHIQKHPHFRIFCVSQNDNVNPCECDRCQAIVKNEGAESGIMIQFVNGVAQSVAQQFPDVLIGTLAYRYTHKPPAHVKPVSNVVIRLCPIEACGIHDLKSCPKNRDFQSRMEEWSKISPQLYIWDYVINFHHLVMPFPNLAVLQSNIRNFKQNKTMGIMEQADYVGRGGELAELRMYLLSKLLWNPEADTDKIIADFVDGYYGRSAQYVHAYLQLLQSLVKPDVHFTLYSGPHDTLYSNDFIGQALLLLDNACKVADNKELLRRIELAAMPVWNLKCLRLPDLAKQDGTYDKLLTVAEREGMVFFGEHLEMSDYMKKFFKPSH